jgi:hypothetical protein
MLGEQGRSTNQKQKQKTIVETKHESLRPYLSRSASGAAVPQRANHESTARSETEIAPSTCWIL